MQTKHTIRLLREALQTTTYQRDRLRAALQQLLAAELSNPAPRGSARAAAWNNARRVLRELE